MRLIRQAFKAPYGVVSDKALYQYRLTQDTCKVVSLIPSGFKALHHHQPTYLTSTNCYSLTRQLRSNKSCTQFSNQGCSVHKTLSRKTETRPRRSIFSKSQDRDETETFNPRDRDETETFHFSNSRDPDETFHFRDQDVFETIKFSNYRKELTEASHYAVTVIGLSLIHI